MNAGLSNLSRFYSTLPEEEFSNRDGVFCSPFCEDVVFLRGAECLGKPPLCRYCREGWIFLLEIRKKDCRVA